MQKAQAIHTQGETGSTRYRPERETTRRHDVPVDNNQPYHGSNQRNSSSHYTPIESFRVVHDGVQQ
jgi:hypothetical protein